MNNKMIDSAKKSQFMIPTIIFIVIAYFIYVVGDFIGGNLAIKLIDVNSFFRTYKEFISLASCCVSSIFLFLWVKFVELRKIKELGFFQERIFKDSVIGSIAGIGSFSVILLIGKILGVVNHTSTNLEIKNVLLVLLIIPFWFIQAASEEVLTRGFVLPMVSAKTNKIIGVLASSLLFVLFHMNNFGIGILAIINIFLIGVLLSVYTLLTDNIWGSIAFHAFWNFIQGSFFGLSVSGSQAMEPSLMNMTTNGNPLFSGGSFGLEASIINTIVISLLLVFVLYRFKQKTLENKEELTK